MDVDWQKLEELATSKFKDVPDDSGIYVVRWSKNGKPVSIGRLEGLDQNGILYIGSAKRLRRRARQLWNGVNMKRGHTIGKTITFCKIFEAINLIDYEIAWRMLETHEEAVGQEAAALCLYSQKFKEPPPLNLALRREMFFIIGLAIVGKFRIGYEPNEFVKSIISPRAEA